MRTSTHLGRRMAALLATAGLAVGGAVVMAPAAQAAPVRGTLSITPTSGIETTPLQATMSVGCAADSTGLLGYVTGPSISEPTLIQGNRSASDGGTPITTFPVQATFKDVFQAASVASPNGVYTVRIACIGPDFFTETGEYSQSVTFTPRSVSGTPVPNGGTFLVTPNAKPATTTTLEVPTADPVKIGTSVTLNASVTAESGTPTGAVQFKAGATNLGAAQPLTAGAAQLVTAAIPAGTQNLTAVYVPGAAEYATSTSAAKPFIVAANAVITGTPRVGSTIGCSGTSGGTRTIAWKRNGVLSTVKTATVKVPASWASATITCSITTAKGETSVVQTAAGKKIALGLAPKAVKKPVVLGTARVGKVLTCAKGTWSPTPTSYKYQWLRAGKVIAGKVSSKYKATKLDKGKLVTCRVTTVKAGYAAGVATAAAKKVK